jgi:hypothetical protein
MTRAQIIKAAEQKTAKEFLEFLWDKRVGYEILDQDNIMDENDGYLNVSVAGLLDGEALLFADGEYVGF